VAEATDDRALRGTSRSRWPTRCRGDDRVWIVVPVLSHRVERASGRYAPASGFTCCWPLECAIEGPPDFTHVSSHKRSPDDVIADRVFFSPAAIVQKGGILAADRARSGPDQPARRICRRGPFADASQGFCRAVDPKQCPCQTALDLNLQTGLTARPVIAYVLWTTLRSSTSSGTGLKTKRRDGPPVVRQYRPLRLRSLRGGGRPPYRGYQRVAAHLWQRYGHAYFSRPRPQTMPFAEYAKVCYPAAFQYQGYNVGR